MKKKKDFSSLTDEALDNIREDRKKTELLLSKMVEFIAKDENHHKEVGFTLAKYLETLQRSNEQLVKIVSLLKKEEKDDSSLSEDDKENIFEKLNKITDLSSKKKQKNG